jgi:hypothetical protein
MHYFGTLQESPPSPLVRTYHASQACPTSYHAITQPFAIETTMMMMMICYITINAFEYYVYLLNCYAFYMYVANVEKQ